MFTIRAALADPAADSFSETKTAPVFQLPASPAQPAYSPPPTYTAEFDAGYSSHELPASANEYELESGQQLQPHR